MLLITGQAKEVSGLGSATGVMEAMGSSGSLSSAILPPPVGLGHLEVTVPLATPSSPLAFKVSMLVRPETFWKVV